MGHSLVPPNIGSVDGATIRIFRSPGAKASSFLSNRILSEVLTWPHEFTILFFGGNDIYDGCVPRNIASSIETVVEQIHNYCHSHIAVVLIEHRDPPTGNRFNVTSSQYNKVANNVNNRLKRKYKNKSYVQFLSVGAKPFQRGVVDGVHFDEESKAHLRRKFRTIQYFINN